MEESDYFDELLNQNDPVKDIISRMKITRTQILPFMKQVADFTMPNLPYVLMILFGCLYLQEYV